MVDIEKEIKSFFHIGCLSLIHLCSPPSFFLQLLITVDYFWNGLRKSFMDCLVCQFCLLYMKIKKWFRSSEASLNQSK